MSQLGKIISLIFLFVVFGICLQTSCSQVKSQTQNKSASNSSNTSSNRLEKAEKKFPTTTVHSDNYETFLPLDTCKKIKAKNEKLLCKQIVEDNESLHESWIKKFEYRFFYVDLNSDGNTEVIVWNSTICGSSGCEIYLYTKTQKGFRKLWGEDIGWTPIIVLNSKKNGWRDVAFQVAGGGVKPHFEILHYSKSVYVFKDRQNDKPEGKIILDKNWKQTFYGPIPNQ